MNRKNFFKSFAASCAAVVISPTILAEAAKARKLKPLTLVYNKIHLRDGTTLNVGYYKEQWEHFDRMTNPQDDKPLTSYSCFIMNLADE